MELDLSHEAAYVFKSANPVLGFAVDEPEAVWVPYEPGTANLFLMFDLNTNSFAVVLRCEPGSGIDRHHHTGAVAGYCLQGSWKYKEHDWVARPGTFVYERAGEAHTLKVLGNQTMLSFFHVMGPHITLDDEGHEIGYVDAFRLLEYCRQYYAEHGLDLSTWTRLPGEHATLA